MISAPPWSWPRGRRPTSCSPRGRPPRLEPHSGGATGCAGPGVVRSSTEHSSENRPKLSSPAGPRGTGEQLSGHCHAAACTHVAAVSTRWGFDSRRHGKMVRFEITSAREPRGVTGRAIAMIPTDGTSTYVTARCQNVAIGFTGLPDVRAKRTGAIASWKSHWPSSAAVAAHSSRSQLSSSHRPIATRPTV